MTTTNSAGTILQEFQEHLPADVKSLSTIEPYAGDASSFNIFLIDNCYMGGKVINLINLCDCLITYRKKFNLKNKFFKN